MKLYRFYEYVKYIKENTFDTPESKINIALLKIQKKIEKMFEKDTETNDDSVMTMDDKERKENSTGASFADMGVNIVSSEISQFSKTSDSYKIKFADETYLYDMTVSINLEEAVVKPVNSEDDNSENSDEDTTDKVQESADSDDISKDVETCDIKFKKYKINPSMELIGEISKKANLDDINEDYIINLKIELDDVYKDIDSGDDFKIDYD